MLFGPQIRNDVLHLNFQTWIMLTLSFVLICVVTTKLFHLYQEYSATRELLNQSVNIEREQQERNQTTRLASLNHQILSEIRQLQ